MSIYAVASKYAVSGKPFTVVAASSGDKYVQTWLKLLGTSQHITNTTHMFHWNVRGRNFGSTHEYFKSVYEYCFGLVDMFAEKARALDIDSPIDVDVFSKDYSFVELGYKEFREKAGIKNKYDAYFKYTAHVLKLLRQAMMVANEEAVANKDLGGQNILQGQIELIDALVWKAESSVPGKKA